MPFSGTLTRWITCRNSVWVSNLCRAAGACGRIDSIGVALRTTLLYPNTAFTQTFRNNAHSYPFKTTPDPQQTFFWALDGGPEIQQIRLARKLLLTLFRLLKKECGGRHRGANVRTWQKCDIVQRQFKEVYIWQFWSWIEIRFEFNSYFYSTFHFRTLLLLDYTLCNRASLLCANMPGFLSLCGKKWRSYPGMMRTFW